MSCSSAQVSGDVAGVARVDCGDGVGMPAPKSKSKSTKCYSSSVAGGIGTVDGGARGLHTDYAASRRLSRASPVGSIFLVAVVSVFPAIHCDSLPQDGWDSVPGRRPRGRERQCNGPHDPSGQVGHLTLHRRRPWWTSSGHRRPRQALAGGKNVISLFRFRHIVASLRALTIGLMPC